MYHTLQQQKNKDHYRLWWWWWLSNQKKQKNTLCLTRTNVLSIVILGIKYALNFFCCFNSARRVYKNPDYEINNNEAIHNNNRSNYWYCWFSLVWFGGLVVWSRHKKKLIVFVQQASQSAIHSSIQAAADNIHTNIFHTKGEWKFSEKKKWKNRKILLCKVVIWNFFIIIIRCKKTTKKG